MLRYKTLPLFLAAALICAVSLPHPAHADSGVLTIAERTVSDQKSVFATVESANVVPARVRTGGTIVELKVKQGDHVDEGQVIATVGDQKLGLQVQAQGAQVKAAQAQLEKARSDLKRGQSLIKEGYITKAQLDQLQATYDIAANNLKSMQAQQSVTRQQQTEGKVLAPTTGRILTVPVTAGTVVMPGDTVATLAEQNYILRLSVPERHAGFIKAGDTIRVDGHELGSTVDDQNNTQKAGDVLGTIKLVYPKVENGRVQADATVKGLGDYFVGQRVRVWINAGERKAIIVPADYIITRDGIDYARLKLGNGDVVDVPVQRGRKIPMTDIPNGVEILSGLKPGDKVVRP